MRCQGWEQVVLGSKQANRRRLPRSIRDSIRKEAKPNP
ncbi:hypothetical protein SynSYN20_02005 [Synechococcus sp. SYN20]|nr:hypothetical protein SynSYN20_02005 [Synechococcus sp. SYN20]